MYPIELLIARKHHSPMRFWLLALLMVLMPVRGWMDGALAGDVPATPDAAATVAQDQAMAVSHQDCAGSDVFGAQPWHTETGSDILATAHGGESCLACHAPALAFDPVAGIALPMPHASPVGNLPHFASAELRPSHKPPIS